MYATFNINSIRKILTLTSKSMSITRGSNMRKKIENESMRFIFRCTRVTFCKTVRNLLDSPFVDSRINLDRAQYYFTLSVERAHPLHGDLGKVKGNRLKTRKSWMDHVLDVTREV